jgi:adenine-specific DNA-methyltransferase
VNYIYNADNLEALKHIKDRGDKYKLVYLDPPYGVSVSGKEFGYDNTFDKAFSTLPELITRCKEVMTDDGSMWVSMGDRYQAHTRVLLDSIFSISNYKATIIWQHAPQGNSMTTTFIRKTHEYIFVYANKKAVCRFNAIPKMTDLDGVRYHNADNDPKGDYRISDMRHSMLSTTPRDRSFVITDPKTGIEYTPGQGYEWRVNQEKAKELVASGEIIFIPGQKYPRRKYYRTQDAMLMRPSSIWTAREVGSTTEGFQEQKTGDSLPFLTPKPLRLMKRIIRMATNEDDAVLDCYGGSGTSAVAAIKLGRKFTLIEESTHAYEHIKTRMDFYDGCYYRKYDAGSLSTQGFNAAVDTDTGNTGETD